MRVTGVPITGEASEAVGPRHRSSTSSRSCTHGAFRQDPALQPGWVSIELLAVGYQTNDAVRITPAVILSQN